MWGSGTTRLRTTAEVTAMKVERFRKPSLVISSLIIGVFVTYLVGKVADRLDLPAINSWAIIHGSWLIIWPATSVGCFFVLRRLFPRSEATVK